MIKRIRYECDNSVPTTTFLRTLSMFFFSLRNVHSGGHSLTRRVGHSVNHIESEYKTMLCLETLSWKAFIVFMLNVALSYRRLSLALSTSFSLCTASIWIHVKSVKKTSPDCLISRTNWIVLLTYVPRIFDKLHWQCVEFCASLAYFSLEYIAWFKSTALKSRWRQLHPNKVYFFRHWKWHISTNNNTLNRPLTEWHALLEHQNNISRIWLFSTVYNMDAVLGRVEYLSHMLLLERWHSQSCKCWTSDYTYFDCLRQNSIGMHEHSFDELIVEFSG